MTASQSIGQSVGRPVGSSFRRSVLSRSFFQLVFSRSPRLLVGQSVGHSECHLVSQKVVRSLSKSVGKLFVHSFFQTFGCHSAVVRYRSSFQLGGRSALALSVCRSVFRSTNGSVSRSVILTIGQPVCRVSQFVVQSIGPSVNWLVNQSVVHLFRRSSNSSVDRLVIHSVVRVGGL